MRIKIVFLSSLSMKLFEKTQSVSGTAWMGDDAINVDDYVSVHHKVVKSG